MSRISNLLESLNNDKIKKSLVKHLDKKKAEDIYDQIPTILLNKNKVEEEDLVDVLLDNKIDKKIIDIIIEEIK